MSNRGAAADIANQRQTAQSTLDSFLAQLLPGSEEFNRLQTEGGRLVQTVSGPDDEEALIRQLAAQLVQTQQGRISEGGPGTALEARTNLATGGLRQASAMQPFEQDTLDALSGMGLDTPTGEIFGDLMTRAKSPDQHWTPYQSTLQQQMSLAENSNRQAFARRGLSGSGLEQEGASRAGNELAIAEADRMNQDRLQKENFRQQQVENFMQIYNAGEGLRNRQIGLEGDLVNLQLGRESNLTGLLGGQTARSGANQVNLLNQQTTREQGLQDQAAAAQAARNAAIGKTIGTGLGTAGGFLIGGPPGAAIGGQLGGSMFGGDASGQLAAQRSQGTASGQPASQTSSLTRQAGQGSGGLDMATLIKLLQQSGVGM